ncbi:MAG TPA: AEC family transporter [Marinobacterium sp.]|nr:AEC family transporter [Marinobacterium sp.]
MFAAFLAAVFPTFCIALIGFWLTRKTDLLRHPGMPLLTTQIALPCLIFHTLMTKGLPPTEMAQLILVTAACVVIGAILVALGCRILGQSPRFYLSTLVNPNTGNFGLPLVFALLGEEALTAAIIISSTITLSHYTLGVAAMSGEAPWRKLFTNAPLVALALGIMFSSFELSPAQPLMRVVEMLSGVALPMLLLLLGSSLASLNLRQRSELGKLALLSIYRPLSGFLIAFAVTRIAGLDSLSSLTLMLQMSMPVAVMSYILTLQYGGPSQRIAALTITSMPVSLLILGLIFAFQSWLV